MSTPRVGVGYRRGLGVESGKYDGDFDVLEVLIEHFIPFTRDRQVELASLLNRFEVVLHSVSLSLGSIEPFRDKIAEFREVIQFCDAGYLSDHISFHRSQAYDIRHLSPVWFTEEQLDVILRNVRHAENDLGVSLVLETITAPFEIPGGTRDWCEFHKELFDASGCGVLLDITNLWINYSNGVGPIPSAAFAALSDNRWTQFHIIGHSTTADGYYIDSHTGRITAEVLDLYNDALKVQRPRFVIVERDEDLAEFEQTIKDVNLLRSLGLRS